MDGVPGLTQPPIKPGESFVYEFTPPDAGTFWYHPHADSLEQLGRGLAGALDRRGGRACRRRPRPALDAAGLAARPTTGRSPPASAARWMRPCRAASATSSPSTATVPADQPVRAGERVRLRLVNACARPHHGAALRRPSPGRRRDRRPALRSARAGGRPPGARPRPCASMSCSTCRATPAAATR